MDAITEHLVNDHHMPAADVAAALAEWEIIPFHRGGQEVGAIMKSGKEIHVAVYQQHRRKAFTAGQARTFLGGILDREKFLVTKLLATDAETTRFVNRIGFRKTHEEGPLAYFWLDKETLIGGKHGTI